MVVGGRVGLVRTCWLTFGVRDMSEDILRYNQFQQVSLVDAIIML